MKLNKTYSNHLPVLMICMLFLISGCSKPNSAIRVFPGSNDAKIQFAVDEIAAALAEKGIQIQIVQNSAADIIFTFIPESGTLNSEGFSLTKNGKSMEISAIDDAGAMYGGLELAEQIRLYGPEAFRETTQNPYMEIRGTKFNIPLDARTPSYTDASDAAQKNIPEMWNIDFWKEYIDNLARHRFNLISLWSLHPFPSMVKVPGYEDVALDDVHRSTIEWQEYYDLEATGLDDPEILDNIEVVKEMTIDEKI
jgi:hypothetical protein